MRDNKKYYSDNEIFRIKVFDILYNDKEQLEKELKNARNSENFWCICGAISELNSLIETFKDF